MMELENRWLRETYVDELIAAAERDERVVILGPILARRPAPAASKIGSPSGPYTWE